MEHGLWVRVMMPYGYAFDEARGLPYPRHDELNHFVESSLEEVVNSRVVLMLRNRMGKIVGK